jgi:hypothetical protein
MGFRTRFLESDFLTRRRPRHLMACGGSVPVRSAGRASLSRPRPSSALPYTFPCRPSVNFCTRIFTTGTFVRQLTNASSRQTLSFAGIRVSGAYARRLLTDYSSMVKAWVLGYRISRSVQTYGQYWRRAVNALSVTTPPDGWTYLYIGYLS